MTRIVVKTPKISLKPFACYHYLTWSLMIKYASLKLVQNQIAIKTSLKIGKSEMLTQNIALKSDKLDRLR